MSSLYIPTTVSLPPGIPFYVCSQRPSPNCRYLISSSTRDRFVSAIVKYNMGQVCVCYHDIQYETGLCLLSRYTIRDRFVSAIMIYNTGQVCVCYHDIYNMGQVCVIQYLHEKICKYQGRYCRYCAVQYHTVDTVQHIVHDERVGNISHCRTHERLWS